MKKILVFGGTRLFGKKLVEKLIVQGCDVTIATRGLTQDDFGNQVNRVIVDREVYDDRFEALAKEKWDVIYDNICYAPNDLKGSLDILRNSTEKYIFTSTLSVFNAAPGGRKEEEFNPWEYPIQMGARKDFSYQEGKRQCEAVLFQKFDVPSVAVRFPIVLDEEDYTRRLHWHIERMKNGENMYFPNLDGKMSFISAEEAAEVLYFVGINDVTGPIHATSFGAISMGELMTIIQSETGKEPLLEKGCTSEEHASPFGVEEDYYMNPTHLATLGYRCSDLQSWLPKLIEKIASKE